MESDRALLLDIEARILDLERSLSALRTEQARIQERLNAYKYPVLTLPTELTSEIFIRFIPVYPAAPPLTGLASPTTLTAMTIRDTTRTPFEPRQIRDVAKAWIQRSEPYPLSIEITASSPDILRELFTQPLAMATARWEYLRFHFPSTFHARIGLSPMPMLRSLDCFSDLVNRFAGFIFYDAPQLRTVHLSGQAALKVTLPWAQLTCLTLLDVDAKECAPILRQTPNLVRCELCLLYTDR
ncbi:F-box domain-containing protein [Mycena sanguinolenta]|uniref:F-box domain-containing protein n=1 Tax=Mycena sanguinolenta TaxID=230812 RepID=A0A8H7DLH1_9AGAR|nr:F-box domain-containing protein [Mycena sanguinolenta]